MGLDNTRVIDIASIEDHTDFAVLRIVDSWSWDDHRAHLLALQEKINNYIEFVEGGQVLESYPNARGRQIVIEIIFRFSLPEMALRFLDVAERTVQESSILLRYQIWPFSQDE